MGAAWFEYKGEKIMYVDYRDNKTEDELFQTLATAEKLVRMTDTEVPMLFNYEGVSLTMGFMNRLKDLGQEVARSQRLNRQAVVGITGLKNILLRGYLRATGETRIKVSSSEKEALDWLIAQKIGSF